jgi:hypothetical protein
MRRSLKLVGVALAIVALVAFGLVGAAFAVGPQTNSEAATAYAAGLGYGEPGNCTEPGDMHRWGQASGNFTGYGEPNDGTGPGDMNRWGWEAGNGTCLRDPALCDGSCQASRLTEGSVAALGYGESGEGAGPGLMNHWGYSGDTGNSWGEPSDGTGPGDQHQWGRG